MRRSSGSSSPINSSRHSASPAPQRDNKPVIGDESGASIFSWRLCLSEKYIANKGETDALRDRASVRSPVLMSLRSFETIHRQTRDRFTWRGGGLKYIAILLIGGISIGAQENPPASPAAACAKLSQAVIGQSANWVAAEAEKNVLAFT